MINERNASELGAEYSARAENQMKVKHIAYGMKPQALRPQTQGTASLAHWDKINSYFLLCHTKGRSPIALASTPLETTSTHQHPIT
jgi:hypothetical protein